MSDTAIAVSALSVSPVKGLRVTGRDAVTLEAVGVPDNRRFFLVDDRSRMVNGKQLGGLNEVVADYSPEERRLTMTFPDGAVVSDEVHVQEPIATTFFSLPLQARPVVGPWSQALSDHVGCPLRLVERFGRRPGVDRGRAGAVSLVSQGSLEAFAGIAGESSVDGRRFRMLIEVSGVAAHAEDAWVGRRLRIGGARVTPRGHVGRCLVTSRHPETGVVDLPTLDLLRSYRGEEETTEPLPFGIYGEVLEPGTVRLGDAVTVD
jgi:uncharacterized protein YcbX